MPNRILRDGIITSEAVNSLSWAEEVFYRRLMSVVDDFGRYYAASKLLRAACYPLHIDKVSDSDIGKWLSSCETAGLVRVYPAQDGKRYLELLNFRQQVRAKDSKFPAFATHVHSKCEADAHLDVVGDEGEDEMKSSTSSSAASLPTCPHREVIALFGKHLPYLPQPKPELWDGQRAKDLTARWRWLLTKTKQSGERYATNPAEALAWFDRFFAYVAQSDFLTGRAGSWACDLGWLVKAENFAKVVQGNYENKEREAA